MRRLAVTVVVDPPTVVAGAGDRMVAVAAADTDGDIAPEFIPA
jgi:hypothetical protein